MHFRPIQKYARMSTCLVNMLPSMSLLRLSFHSLSWFLTAVRLMHSAAGSEKFTSSSTYQKPDPTVYFGVLERLSTYQNLRTSKFLIQSEYL